MEEVIQYVPNLYATFWALIPPLVAIILALITKEVYSSLFVGIVIGGLFYGNIFQSGFSFEKSVLHIFEDGLVGVLSDPYNVGILVFLVVLGIMVCMMNKAGGSAAFGEWAGRHIKTRVGAQLVTVLLGILIFIDDYFNSDSISIPANYSDGYITAELDDYINFRIVSKAKVKKGYVKAYFDDEKPYFTKEFIVYNDKLYVSSVKIKTSFDKFYKHNTFNLEYVAVDENGIEYSTIQKSTFSINGNKIDLDNSDETSKKLTFPNGKTITSPTDE